MKKIIIFIFLFSTSVFAQIGRYGDYTIEQNVTFDGSATFTGTVSFSAAVTINASNLTLTATEGGGAAADNIILNPGTSLYLIDAVVNNARKFAVDSSGTLFALGAISLNTAGTAYLTLSGNDFYFRGISGGAFRFLPNTVEVFRISPGGMVSAKIQSTTLAAAATTLAITSQYVILTGDAGANTITTITGAMAGQAMTLTLEFVDGNVTITDTNDAGGANTVDLNSAFTSADDTILVLSWNGTNWKEVSRSAN